MKAPKGLCIAAGLLFASLSASLSVAPRAFAQESDEEDGNGGSEPVEKGPFCVVQIGTTDVRIVEKSELSALRKKLDAEYRATLKEYATQRKAARKSKEKFTEPKPRRPVLKVISATLATKEEAVRLRDQTLARIDGFMVVRVGDELKALRKSAVETLRKELDAGYRKALHSYKEEKDEARKARKRFRGKKPPRTLIKVLASNLPTEEAARKRMEELADRAKSRKSKPNRQPSP